MKNIDHTNDQVYIDFLRTYSRLSEDELNELIDEYNESKSYYSKFIDLYSGFYYIGFQDKDKLKEDELAKGNIIGNYCSDIYKKDKEIYLGEILLDGIDGNSFKILTNYDILTFRDKNGIYTLDSEKIYGSHGCSGINKINKIIKQEIIKSPETFELFDDITLARDKYNIYLFSYIEDNKEYVDEKGKKYQENGFKDNKGWILLSYIESPETFELFDKRENGDFYGKDKNNIYIIETSYGRGNIIKGIDVKTFEFLSGDYARDKNNIYYGYNLTKVEDIDYDSFRILENNVAYSKDKDHVYYRGEKLYGSDLDTFKISYPEIGNGDRTQEKTFQTEDKNFIYLYGRRTESINNYRIVKEGDNIKISYELSVLDGESNQSNIIEFNVGTGSMIRGINKGVLGMIRGEEKVLTLNPEDAFGSYSEFKIKEFKRADFKSFEDIGIVLKEGTTLSTNLGIYKIISIDGDNLIIDTNNPLAGKTLIINLKFIDFIE